MKAYINIDGFETYAEDECYNLCVRCEVVFKHEESDHPWGRESLTSLVSVKVIEVLAEHFDKVFERWQTVTILPDRVFKLFPDLLAAVEKKALQS